MKQTSTGFVCATIVLLITVGVVALVEVGQPAAAAPLVITPSAEPPTDTPVPVSTDTPAPPPTDTPVPPPTNTPIAVPTDTPVAPTATTNPTAAPVVNTPKPPPPNPTTAPTPTRMAAPTITATLPPIVLPTTGGDSEAAPWPSPEWFVVLGLIVIAAATLAYRLRS